MSEAKVIAEIKTDWPLETTRAECAVIALDQVTREYAGHSGTVRALDHATFSIVAGFVGLPRVFGEKAAEKVGERSAAGSGYNNSVKRGSSARLWKSESFRAW